MIDRQRAARPESRVTIIPPSPELTVLVDWKLKHPAIPHEPTPRPRHAAPWAWAQSSMSGMLRFSAQRVQSVQVAEL